MSQTLHVRCLVCGEVLGYQREETGSLLVHLRNKHPMHSLGRLDILQRGQTTVPGESKRIYRDRLFREPNQLRDAPCIPSECERIFLEKLAKKDGAPCNPIECERELRGRMLLDDELSRESEKKLNNSWKSKGGCKPYCRVFDTSEKSYPDYLPCGCGPGADKDSEECGCDPFCEPKTLLAKGDWKRSLSAGRVNKRLKKELNKKMYQTTVETWKPGNNKIVCPKCGYEGQPVVRRLRNKVYHSPLGAVCMLGCWPICFLPFMICGNQVVNLYCSQCNHFLGTYDRKRDALIEKDTNQASSASTVQSRRSEPTICACKPDCRD